MAKTAAKPRKKRVQTKMTLALFSMMLPGFIYLLINNYIPMAGLTIAFKRFDYSKGIWGSEWCGFDNFTYLFKTQDAVNIIRNTIGYNLVFIILGNVLAVAVAIMLNNLRGQMNKKIYQTVILIPYLISMVVVSYIVFGFLSQENGFLKPVQVEALKNYPNLSNVTQFSVISIMNDALPKKSKESKLSFSAKKLDKYFPPQYSTKERENIIIQLLEQWSADQVQSE